MFAHAESVLPQKDKVRRLQIRLWWCKPYVIDSDLQRPHIGYLAVGFDQVLGRMKGIIN